VGNNKKIDDWQEVPVDDWQEVPVKQDVPFYTLRPEMLGAGFLAGLGKIDEYTGAPIRKFVTETTTGQKLEKAPTGAEQAAMMGAPTATYGETYGIPKMLGGGLSPADIYGAGLEMVQDPLMLGTAAAKGITKGAELFKGLKGAETAAKGAAEAEALASAKSSTKGAQEAIQQVDLQNILNQEATIGGGEQVVKTQGELFKVKAPQSIKEIAEWKAPSGLDEMQQLKRMREIQTTLPDLQVPPTELHFKMFEDPKAMKNLKGDFDNLSSPQKSQLAKYNIAMLNESAKKTENLINDIGGGNILKPTDQGHKFIEDALTKYNTHKTEAGPLFEKMQKSKPLTPEDVDFLKGAVINNTKAAPLLDVDEAGAMILKPNNTKTGLSDSEYNAIKRVFDDLNGKISFTDIKRQRDYLRKMIDPANPGATEELGKVRTLMLDQLEEMAAKKVPEMRETFRAYAQNEQAIDNIEKMIGGKLESLNKIYSANPEGVVKKVLANPNNQQIVSEYLGPQAYNEILASYLQQGYKKSFDEVRGFKPHDMRRFIAQNENLLGRSLSPEQIERMKALADHGYLARRFLDEVNPSGTVDAFMKAIEPGTFTQEVIQKGPVSALKQTALSKVLTGQKQKQSLQTLNEVLAGAGAKAEAEAAAQAQRAALYESLKAKLPSQEAAGAAAGTGAVLRMQPKKKEEKPKTRPDQSSIMEKTTGTPYERLLRTALEQGGEQSFSAANYVLMNRDENYRKLINQEEV
jgi:flagellar basal body rod protein FlgC